MQTIETTKLIDNLRQINGENIRFVEEHVNLLNEKQLQWKPSAKAWSILEIFAHLNASAQYYQNIIHKKILENKDGDTSTTFTSSPLGLATWGQVKLGKMRNIKKRVKSARVFNPEFFGLAINAQEINRFLQNANSMFEILEGARKVNLRKIKLPMAVSKFVHLRLGDALLFHVYHNERHMEQINKNINQPGFPK